MVWGGSPIIGNNVNIGSNSCIIGHVTIGDNVIIGAGSIVTRDIKPWAIYFQNKIIGYRNKEDVLKNYEKFLATPENERVGSLFK